MKYKYPINNVEDVVSEERFESEEISESLKLARVNKKYQSKLILLVVQISVCLLILGGATILKSFGGNYFEYVKQWYNEKINDSLIVEKSIKEYQSVINEKFSKNTRFLNYDSKNLPPINLSVKLFEPLSAGTITSHYGARIDPITGQNSLHNGLDIGTDGGNPIYAVLPGTIKRAEKIGGYGNCIVIDHGNDIETLYGHCKSLSVATGTFVERGQEVALVGSSGRATGNHLHFEIAINGEKVNPETFLSSVYV